MQHKSMTTHKSTKEKNTNLMVLAIVIGRIVFIFCNAKNQQYAETFSPKTQIQTQEAEN